MTTTGQHTNVALQHTTRHSNFGHTHYTLGSTDWQFLCVCSRPAVEIATGEIRKYLSYYHIDRKRAPSRAGQSSRARGPPRRRRRPRSLSSLYVIFVLLRVSWVVVWLQLNFNALTKAKEEHTTGALGYIA